MKRSIVQLLPIFFCSLISCSGSKGPVNIDWLTGKWVGHVSEIVYSEYWSKLSEENFDGTSYVVQEGDTVYRDKLKINIIGDLPCFVISLPKNKEPVIFKMTGNSEKGIVFENNEHDFPKLIAYEINGDSLHVRFEGIREGKKAREEVYYRKK